MRLQFAAMAALAVTITACKSPKILEAPLQYVPDPEAIRQAYKTDAYVKINATPFTSTGAHSGPKFLYVDKENSRRYRRGFKGELPAMATIVKATEDESFVAIMQKLETGTDPAADDWYYYEKIGTSVVFDGNKTSGGGLCHSCHKSAAATDNLLGLDVFTTN